MIGFGVGLPGETQGEGILHHGKMLEMAQPAWWYDWMDLVPEDRRYVPMLRRLWRANVADAYPLGQRDRSRYWFVGNEPERGDQDATDPGVYVAALGGWCANVGNCVAIGGVQVNDGGMDWLTECLRLLRASGTPKLYSKFRWHIHIYANDGTEWMQKWLRFNAWMQTHRCHRPVVISETASISTTVGNQVDVMATAFNAMRKYEWLVGIGWFSAHYSTFKREYERTDLFDKRGVIKPLGEWFHTFATHS